MKAFQVFVLLSPFVYGTFACNGWNMSNFKIGDCKDDGGLLKFNNFRTTLNSACDVIAYGSVEITQQINDCNVTYTLNRDGQSMMPAMKMTGKKKLSTVLEDSKKSTEAKEILNGAGINKLPIEPKTVNLDGTTVSVAKHKDKMGIMSGSSRGTIAGRCDTPNGVVVVCQDLTFTLTKTGGARTKMFSG